MFKKISFFNALSFFADCVNDLVRSVFLSYERIVNYLKGTGACANNILTQDI